jgi:hypothetical protein
VVRNIKIGLGTHFAFKGSLSKSHLDRDFLLEEFDFLRGAGSTRHISPNRVLVHMGLGEDAAFFTPQTLAE